MRDRVLPVIAKLNECNHIQRSSESLMNFQIQDLLDFAQIRHGKFRVNIKKFNVREAVNKVIDIQKSKANAKGVELEATFDCIAKDHCRNPM